MLHKDPFNVAPETFRLIQQLQALPILDNFYLVGGTALALKSVIGIPLTLTFLLVMSLKLNI